MKQFNLLLFFSFSPSFDFSGSRSYFGLSSTGFIILGLGWLFVTGYKLSLVGLVRFNSRFFVSRLFSGECVPIRSSDHKVRINLFNYQIKIRGFLPAPLHFSFCTPTFFKNTEITLYSFRYFWNSGSVSKGYLHNRKSEREKLIPQHLFLNTFFFISRFINLEFIKHVPEKTF